MKNHKHLVKIVIIEAVVLYIFSRMGFRVESPVFNAIAVFLFFLPVELLLLSTSRLPDKPPLLRGICKFAFWWIIVCYVSVTVLKILSAMGILPPG